MDSNTLDKITARLGEKKNMGFSAEDVKLQGTLAAATCTLTVYDSTGAVVSALNGVSASITGTTKIEITYYTTFGSSMNITAAGDYNALWALTSGTTIRVWEQPWQILAAP